MRIAVTLRSVFIACVTLLTFGACGNPIPPDKSAYVGEWQSASMHLIITQDGSVRYERKNGNKTTKIEAPLKAFSGDNFAVGIGPMSTTFVVNARPQHSAGRWLMTVDGVVLTKVTE